ncbi:hypothetical protein PUNSTDRAFT_146275 [Punctularia strigosozonata HHB-11173 SS5]|uniref:Uncharacterized protein n=1 Tax=Punctularia strigosozonata (strain HHB-11173) TaxID=741275 RepID=R7S2Y4_PUNST|nr:uncharacterized protein PUNSTDRAFT_146275 [Punctularia strigosozonata HHB-11173 SS5]EIN04588.1 hypothetical protein PUNSTDRAFT_146275 [Punctularia strigosozonata HHB-11173 SS5]
MPGHSMPHPHHAYTFDGGADPYNHHHHHFNPLFDDAEDGSHPHHPHLVHAHSDAVLYEIHPALVDAHYAGVHLGARHSRSYDSHHPSSDHLNSPIHDGEPIVDQPSLAFPNASWPTTRTSSPDPSRPVYHSPSASAFDFHPRRPPFTRGSSNGSSWSSTTTSSTFSSSSSTSSGPSTPYPTSHDRHQSHSRLLELVPKRQFTGYQHFDSEDSGQSTPHGARSISPKEIVYHDTVNNYWQQALSVISNASGSTRLLLLLALFLSAYFVLR